MIILTVGRIGLSLTRCCISRASLDALRPEGSFTFVTATAVAGDASDLRPATGVMQQSHNEKHISSQLIDSDEGRADNDEFTRSANATRASEERLILQQFDTLLDAFRHLLGGDWRPACEESLSVCDVL